MLLGWSVIKVSRRGRIGFSWLQIWLVEGSTLNVLTLSLIMTCQILLILICIGYVCVSFFNFHSESDFSMLSLIFYLHFQLVYFSVVCPFIYFSALFVLGFVYYGISECRCYLVYFIFCLRYGWLTLTLGLLVYSFSSFTACCWWKMAYGKFYS